MSQHRHRRAATYTTTLLLLLGLVVACTPTNQEASAAYQQLPGAGNEPAWWETIRVETTRPADGEQDPEDTPQPPDQEPDPKPEISLILPADVGFDTGSATVHPHIRERFYELGVCLAGTTTRIDIAGHTDSVGAAEMNQQLSDDRASNVAQIFIDAGVDPDVINDQGYGQSRPIADEQGGDPEDARARNRRVEITIRTTSDCQI